MGNTTINKIKSMPSKNYEQKFIEYAEKLQLVVTVDSDSKTSSKYWYIKLNGKNYDCYLWNTKIAYETNKTYDIKLYGIYEENKLLEIYDIKKLLKNLI